MTRIIVEALEKTGQRGIINKGWGGLGNCKFLHYFLAISDRVFAVFLF
jgi:sterol 3beta-glucosyltransferase